MLPAVEVGIYLLVDREVLAGVLDRVRDTDDTDDTDDTAKVFDEQRVEKA